MLNNSPAQLTDRELLDAIARAVDHERRTTAELLSLLADGAITLTTIARLAGHLTDENHEALLEAARHKSKDEVERLIVALHPQPDIASSVRTSVENLELRCRAHNAFEEVTRLGEPLSLENPQQHRGV